MKYSKIQLIKMMNEGGYTQIESERDYVMSFLHKNGMSVANYQKRKDLWETCF